MLAICVAFISGLAAIVFVSPGNAATTPRPSFQLPFTCGENWRLSTYRGHQDYDIDFFANDGGGTAGRTVLASAAGTVIWAGWDGKNSDGSQAPPGTVGTARGLGFGVIIGHGGGWVTMYGHFVTWPLVSTGQQVNQGQHLGNVGKTGATRVEHLHYEQLDDTIDSSKTRGERDKVESYFDGVPSGITTDGSASTGPIFVDGPISPTQYRISNNCGALSAARPVAAVARAAGWVDAFWMAPDGALGHTWSLGGSHSGEEVLADTRPMNSVPSAAVAAGEVLEVFWLGMDRGLWHKRFDGAWQPTTRIEAAGTLGSPPRAVGHPDGRVEVFWRGTNEGLWSTVSRDGVNWSSAINLGANPLGSDPYPVVAGTGVTHVFWKGADRNLWRRWTVDGGATWLGAENLGMGPLGSAPVAVGQPNGTVDVFWKGTNAGLWSAHLGGTWTGPHNLGAGELGSDPFPAKSTGTTADVFWQGTNGNLWHKWTVDGGATWHGPENLGMGQLGSAPVAVGQPNGTVDVFWKGTNAGLWSAHYGGAWTGPHNFGGRLG